MNLVQPLFEGPIDIAGDIHGNKLRRDRQLEPPQADAKRDKSRQDQRFDPLKADPLGRRPGRPEYCQDGPSKPILCGTSATCMASLSVSEVTQEESALLGSTPMGCRRKSGAGGVLGSHGRIPRLSLRLIHSLFPV
jgi:hypothetical protein